MTLDSCARLHVDRKGRFRSYRTMGTIGYGAALALAFALHRAAGADVVDAALVSLAAPVSFLVAVKLSFIVFGYERIVFYEKALAALGAAALTLHLAGRPLAPGLDLTMLGVGTFLAFGRLGCLMVGCCYGRPARRGIRYTPEHALMGFPSRLVGVPLVPIQLADALLSLGLVAAGVVLAILPHAPGAPTVLWLEGYGVGRFALEILRGDHARPRMRGLTEAQWTAILVAWGVVAVHGATALTLGFAIGLTAAGAALIAVGARWSILGITSPWHARELADAIEALRRLPAGSTRSTSLGVRASLHRLPGIEDYIVSREHGPLDERTLQVLAPQLGSRAIEIVPGRTPGLFHLVVR